MGAAAPGDRGGVPLVEQRRARTYRQKEGIPDDLGTAVTVQAMVFGNRGPDSATGVLFTRNPATGEPILYGDVMFDAQGEDVVSGTHETEPIAVLDERMPAVAAELRDHATRLERHYADLCDIEFTIEEGRLWLLQVRVGKRSPQAALRIAVDMAEDASFPAVPGGGRRAGRAAARGSADDRHHAQQLRPAARDRPAGVARGGQRADRHEPGGGLEAADAGRPPILVRAETSPDDVHGMARAAGILTSRGGLASHAAVVARGWGIPAVVGATGIEVRDGQVVVGEQDPRRRRRHHDRRRLRRGLRRNDPGYDRGRAARPGRCSRGRRSSGSASGTTRRTPIAPETPATGRKVTPDDCLRAIAIKGLAQLEGVADVVLSPPDDVRPILDQLVVDGLAATVAGAYRLTESGTLRARELLLAEQGAWGVDRALAALDAFLALDHRVKDAVTAWQLRGDADDQVANDHTDADYDRGVLDRLAALHGEAMAWLTEHEPGWLRLADYRIRLGRAIARAQGGDGRYVASPRVDSYHGIWFELHEDLIQLAGRSRADEVAAGRA